MTPSVEFSPSISRTQAMPDPPRITPTSAETEGMDVEDAEADKRAKEDVDITVNRTVGSIKEVDTTKKETTKTETTKTEIERAIAHLVAGDFHQRWDRAKQFSRKFASWGDRVVPSLIQQLHSQKDPDTQWFLVRILSQFDCADTVKAIAQILVSTPSETLQVEASKALTALGSSTIETLSGLVISGNPVEQRRLAAKALSHIRRTATIEPLLSIATDPDAELRAIATEALGSFHAPVVTDVLLNALNDEPEIALEAIRALGRRRDLLATTDLATPLIQCLHSPSETIARESATALGRLGDDSTAAALGETLTAPVATTTKVAAIRALSWIGNDTAIEALTKAFSEDDIKVPPQARQEIARGLGQTRDEALKPLAVRSLIAALQTHTLKPQTQRTEPAPETFALKQAMISALARLGLADAIDTLIPVLADPDPRIQMHALSALTQIDPRVAQARVQQYIEDQTIDETIRTRVSESLQAW
ncbi:MAG: HEAT repeat domain-containing protein [Cyanobacteria bacterium J06649_4]